MTAEHLSISTRTACPTGPQSAVCPHVPNRNTQGFTVNTALDLSRREDSRGRAGEGFTLGKRRLFFQFVSRLAVFSLYELSRASRTFMICCLMTLVASPALGIKYLKERWEKKMEKTAVTSTN